MYYVCSMANLHKALDEIADLIAEDVPAARAALGRFTDANSLSKNKAISARVALLNILIAATNNTLDNESINDKKLLQYFEKNRRYDDAAQLLLAKTKHYLNRGLTADGIQQLDYIKQHLLAFVSPRTEISYLHYTTQLYAIRGEHAQRILITEQAFEKLKQLPAEGSWWYGMYVLLNATIADVYQRNRQHEEAWPYLQQALQMAESKPVSAQHKFHLYRHVALHYNFKAETAASIKWYENALTQLTTEDNLPYLIVTNSNLAYQYYWLYQETPATHKALRAKQMERMEQLLKQLERYNKKLKQPVHRANLLVTRSRVEWLKQNYAAAIRLLETSLPVYKKHKQERSLVEHHQLMHKAWHAWGLQTNHAKRLATAYKYLVEYTEMVKEDAKKTTAEKLNAVKTKYELNEQKLQQQLMKQQIDTLDSELQLTTLNLHDKIRVLDDIKNHVHSLNRKGIEISQLSKSVLQKIDSVKITEQDKNRLQQKLNESNKHLGKLLLEKHPTLTNLEISMCGLFKTGITDKELASLYGQSYKAYEQHRWRIKKKMKLDRKTDLVKYLQQLVM